MNYKAVQRTVVVDDPILHSPTFLRASNALRMMRERAIMADRLDEVEAMTRAFVCSDCKITETDPIFVIVARDIVLACPRCSGETLRGQWENEVPNSWMPSRANGGMVQLRPRKPLTFVETTFEEIEP